MDGTCKEWWYKDKMTGVSKKKYFCLFQPDILTINYRCLEDFLLIFGPSWAQNTILPKKEKRERESERANKRKWVQNQTRKFLDPC